MKETHIAHPIIASYVENFIYQHEISEPCSLDKHAIFEQYINELILLNYTNDPNANYLDMDTGTAFGIDGVAIFVADKLVTNLDDVQEIINDLKNFDVDFYFTQVKTADKFDRRDIADFFQAVVRFFNFKECSIPELQQFWEISQYIYKNSNKFKKQPQLHLKFICLSAKDIDLDDVHLKSTIDLAINDLSSLNLFYNFDMSNLEFIGIKKIMELRQRANSDLEVTISLSKSLIPYPKDQSNKIKSSYYGLIKLSEFVEILTEVNGDNRLLRKRIFNDNIRYYLGVNEKIEVNLSMKNQLLDKDGNYLFGLLNNGITVICDEIKISSEELTLINFQIVNGCQTSNVIYECLEELSALNKLKKEDIYLPIRLIATEDNDTKNKIIVATNSQTVLKPEQLIALSPIQKAIEEYYNTKNLNQKIELFYERRTEQYRDDNIPKTKIINIHYQIKSVSALFFDLPHEVSGQYGKVEKNTKNLLFKEGDLSYLNSYYVAGLAWYRVERFIANNEIGKKYRRARWHIIMLLKYYICNIKNINLSIDKNSEKNSRLIEDILLDENKSNETINNIINIIEEYLTTQEGGLEKQLDDRKLFERKETTSGLISFISTKK